MDRNVLRAWQAVIEAIAELDKENRDLTISQLHQWLDELPIEDTDLWDDRPGE